LNGNVLKAVRKNEKNQIWYLQRVSEFFVKKTQLKHSSITYTDQVDKLSNFITKNLLYIRGDAIKQIKDVKIGGIFFFVEVSNFAGFGFSNGKQ